MDKIRAALTSFLASVAVSISKSIAWLLTFSLAVLTDVIHSAADAISVFLTYLAVKYSMKPPDLEHPYGHNKAETLGGLGGSIAVLLSIAIVVYEGFHKLANWEPYTPNLVAIGILAGAIAIDANRVAMLKKFAGASRALEADALHFSADLAFSSSILAMLIFGYVASLYDPRLFSVLGPLVDVGFAMAISIFFARLGLKLVKMNIAELLDYSPPDVVSHVRERARSVEGVEKVKNVKVRKAGNIYHAEITVEVPSNYTIEEAHRVADEIERSIKEVLKGEVVVHVEPARGDDELPL